MEENMVKRDVKVFISYCWTSDELKDWVREELATRLLDDGVDVVLDQWDLKEGHDVYSFMESMVTDPSVDKVLVICDKGYKEKADARKGGVGTETQIITPEIYNKTKQEKFIPIVVERGENGEVFLPAYMASRKFIDMSTEERFLENYEQLLRVIYERPAHRKPKKGSPPAYLFQDEEINEFKFQFILRQIQQDFQKERFKSAQNKVSNFKDEFIRALEEFVIDSNSNDIAQEVENQIDNMLTLRDNFIELIETLINYDSIQGDKIIGFFEDLYNKFISIKSSFHSYNQLQFDHYKFLIKELFVYTVSALLKYEYYPVLSDILYGRYFVYNGQAHREKIGRGYELFSFYIKALDDIQVHKTEKKYFSYSAEKMIRRSTEKYNKRMLTQTDLFLYYISALKADEQYYWFPRSYVYAVDTKLDIFVRLESKRYFEKVKCLFNVETKDELIDLFSKFKNPYQIGYPHSLDTIPDILYHIDLENICKYR